MPSLRITVNGQIYAIGCGAGEEERVRALAEHFNHHVEALAADVGRIAESRLLILAGLKVCEELADLKDPSGETAEIGAMLGDLATRIEACADILDKAHPAPEPEMMICDNAATLPDLTALYRETFPDEDLVPLVTALLAEAAGVTHLTAMVDGKMVGHVALTDCSVGASAVPVGLLGPLAVAPSAQHRGIGRSLIAACREHAQTRSHRRLLVLGDPQYYGKFGFTPERDVKTPYPLPPAWADAWQSLSPGGAEETSSVSGPLAIPEPWAHESLWSGA